MAIRLVIRKDTETNWRNVNPILSQGELAAEYSDDYSTEKLKIRRWEFSLE